MMRVAYLIVLIVSLAGLVVIDRRHRLAFFYEPKTTAITLLLATAYFLAWDLAGIGLGIFFIGGSPYLTGLRLAPELPIEEVFFLLLLSYTTLLAWQGGRRLWPRT